MMPKINTNVGNVVNTSKQEIAESKVHGLGRHSGLHSQPEPSSLRSSPKMTDARLSHRNPLAGFVLEQFTY